MKKVLLIEIENKALKQIKKLDLKVRKKVNKKIKSLEENPFPKNKKHFLSSNKHTFLSETNIEEIRIYYKFTLEKIIILNIEYKGIVKILEVEKKSGKQQKTISRLKKIFKNKFL
jgi:mRNA-degrading endonuclease RelE of RelBE toxin-antitoxin system